MIKVFNNINKMAEASVYQRLGERLIKAGIITQAQLDRALEEQKISGGRLGYNLIRLGYIDEETLVSFLAKEFGLDTIKLRKIDIDQSLISLIPQQVAERYQVIPVSKDGNKLVVATSDPFNIFILNDLEFITEHKIELVLAEELAVREAIDRYYGSPIPPEILEELREEVPIEIRRREKEELDLEKLHAEEAPVVKLVNHILINAIKKKASDIHIEPYKDELRVRYRIDGVLHDFMNMANRLEPSLTARLKIMAALDIAEKRRPQDGRIEIKVGQRDIDIRVSIIPTLYGEKTVLRLLDKSSGIKGMEELGLSKEELNKFLWAIKRPYGMILVTGPTGSGKTTTLYAVLNKLNSKEVNILTAEDPVEYTLEGINQVQINEKIGLTFSSALRSFLRQDPDIIMVGEIRDLDTADIAIKAALTGHLVLSTLHTNDAPSTITRLLDMNIEPFLVSSSLIAIIAQRLVRVICPHCRERVRVRPELLTKVGFSPEEAKTIKVYQGKGCSSCNYTGYRGRVALFEILIVSDAIRNAILARESADKIREIAISEGMKTLRASGLEKIKIGITTIEEVLRVT
ncbi:MAG: type IV-A pilus assembly ATPase PilB [Deltaproteobacteria bacterium]|nr:type IV-A pilus assembly ATPase PilB [Deltaproteobacteria bacterium]